MGIVEIGFYFLLEIQESFFETKIFKKIQILGIIEKCIGWFLIYLFLGFFFFLIKSAKKGVYV